MRRRWPTDKKSVERNVMLEVRYLASGVYYSDKKDRFISHLVVADRKLTHPEVLC
jgi:hypothetical protein